MTTNSTTPNTPPPTSGHDIRRAFLDFFAERGHREVRSYALIPPDDPTLYFVNAGMVQFKDVFVGARTVDYSRATTCQKCLRVSGKHNDLENVGRTARHHTFFEMLGNFSFGDYFKRDAIRYGWDFITKVLGLPEDKLYVTVYPEDEEAERIWKEEVGVAPERVFHDPDNFWSMADTGPCGPCSEIHYDLGPSMSGGKEVPFGHPEADDRYMELWNLVFMQFDRAADGTMNPLPKPSIDTGAGLERLALVMQGKASNYETDLFWPIIERVAHKAGVDYGANGWDDERDVALRVIADHSRAAAFLIADGIYPDNEGRGYVLRRIMRRAIRFGRLLGFTEPFLVDTTAHVVELMGATYPELREGAETIHRIVLQEEKRFGRTINAGLKRLDAELARLADAGETTLDGRVAFELYDTHGFPPDLTALICGERGVEVDQAGFDAGMEEQRARARAASKFGGEDTTAYQALVEAGMATQFTGYETEEGDSQIAALLVEGERVPQAAAGQTVALVTPVTPFYAESGGQVGDVGVIETRGGARLRVTDTQKPFGDLIVHYGVVEGGSLREGEDVHLAVDHEAREATRRNHSATHLMHHALRSVLGAHVRQRGSMVGPHRLRFDFSHTGGMTPEEIREVERQVNAHVLANDPIETQVLPMDDAIAAGAIAFFEEKYGATVRMLKVGPDSTELCGGTHARRTGDIGLFKIVAEGAISSGVRRVEAVTGMNAVTWAQDTAATLHDVAEQLRVGVPQVADRVDKLLAERKELHAALDEARVAARLAAAKAALADAPTWGGARVAAVRIDGVPGKELRAVAERLRAELGGPGAVLIAGQADDGKVSLVVAATKDVAKKLHAGKTVGQLAPLVGGRGGGRPDLAQAGGSDAEQLGEVLARFRALAEQALT